LRILFISQSVPYPLNTGTRVRGYYVLKRLAQFGQVTLLHYTRSEAESTRAQFLRPLCERIVSVPLRRSRALDMLTFARSLPGRTPFFILRDDSTLMRRTALDLASSGSFDVAHADQLVMAQFARLVPDVATLVDNYDVLSDRMNRMAVTETNLLKKLAMWIDAVKLRGYERQIFAQFDAVLAVSETDAQKIGALAGGQCEPVTVPIGIDCETIRPIARQRGAVDILNVGTMSYPPNADGVTWFARQILPLVSQYLPGITFRIVGDKPDPQVRALTANPFIIVTGYVEDLGPLVAQSAVFVVPLRSGSGMRVKILNAFAQGIPVVSTRLGCEGIDVVDGEHLLLADTPKAFAEAVVRVIRDPVLAERLAGNARRLVESRYSWQTVYANLDAVYDRLAACRGEDDQV
jgi:glycosyltransferase involved in cell wall biosynthesis